MYGDPAAPGLQAVRLFSLDGRALRLRINSKWRRVRVKAIDPARGTAVLQRGQNAAEICIALKTMKRFGLEALRPEETVEIRWVENRGKGWIEPELRRPLLE